MCEIETYETCLNLSGWSKFIMNKKLIFSLALTFLLTTVATAALNVPSGPYPTIQSAIDAANPGDEIVLADGTYNLSGRVLSRTKLAGEFARYASESKPPVFRIRMDAKATAQQFISVMDELKKANLTRITFDTQTEG